MAKTIDGGVLNFSPYEKGESSKIVRVSLFSDEVTLAKMELIISANDFKNPETYRASFLLNEVRVRGVDFQNKAVRKGYKEVIPKGWHQNINNPNAPKENKHAPVDMADIKGLSDFARKACQLWNIEYKEPENELFQ